MPTCTRRIFSPMTGLLALTVSISASARPGLARLKAINAQFTPVELKVDYSKLSKADMQALRKILSAARLMDDLYLQQRWSGNPALKAKLAEIKTPLGKARFQTFENAMGPWSPLGDGEAFIEGVPEKHPPGAGFYPEDMTKTEFEAWVARLSPDQQTQAKGFFTVIRRKADRRLETVPFSREYSVELKKASELLKSAAKDTPNSSLKKFLNLRADAFLSDNYYSSDMAWMDLDSTIDVTIGPYETYNDELFGYKAAFEAFISLRDDAETAKLAFFGNRLQEVENNLPIDPKYRNPKLGALAPIRVVNELLATGDANHGVRTAAYNLPNDDKVIQEKGSKRVMLKNVQEAKFKATLIPISKLVLSSGEQKNVKFDSFFTHILAHELSHGIGPHKIMIKRKETSPREELKDLYSAIEEAKADITGLFMLQYIFDHGGGPGLKIGKSSERELYTTFLASGFRTLRFGLNEAHGKGMAMQMNYLMDKGGFRMNPKSGTFEVDLSKIKGAVRDLTHDLLTLEATGDYAGAKKLLDEKAVVGPNLKKALDRLSKLPVDILPVPVTADKIAKE